MRRLSSILKITGVVVLVTTALLISGLRFALPHLDNFRPQILAIIEKEAGFPVQIKQLDATWQNFGPALQLSQVSLLLPEGEWQAERVSVALDVWRSLLNFRLQFRELTFFRLNAHLGNSLFRPSSEPRSLPEQQMEDLLLRRLDRFDLQESQITFLTPSGEQATLIVPYLTWLNQPLRHRAEGVVQMTHLEQQQGIYQVRMDLKDKDDVLDEGRLYFQADEVDISPWLPDEIKEKKILEKTRANLAVWLTLKKGQLDRIDAQLEEGLFQWQFQQASHELKINKLLLNAQRKPEGAWHLEMPVMQFFTDGQAWPSSPMHMLWMPKEEQIRIRAGRLSLQAVAPLLSWFSPSAQWFVEAERLKLQGELNNIAFDIPLQNPQASHFKLGWREVAWLQPNSRWPGMTHFSGQATGSLEQGIAQIEVGQGKVPYEGMFRAPFDIEAASGKLRWHYSEDKGGYFRSDSLQIKAHSLWANGAFNLELPAEGEPYLGILAGIRLYDANQAWRYYPEPLMGSPLTHYLSSALQAGKVDNATLIYAGNPKKFPFAHHEGVFQVWVPLREATFHYGPGWPALENLAIDLNFLNDGLWMYAQQTALGKAIGHNIQADIPHYRDEKLLINADIKGKGPEIRDYFKASPLKHSVGVTLDQLSVTGEVGGRLHLDIPLDGKPVNASGQVFLRNNQLVIEPIHSTFEKVSGEFRFRNGELTSDTLSADWFGQSVRLNFSTHPKDQEYQIQVGIQGDWEANRVSWMPEIIKQQVQGVAEWQTDIDIRLPHQGKMHYQATLQGDLSGVSSHLPSPLSKPTGERLPLEVGVKGDAQGFTLSGLLSQDTRFNSQWRIIDASKVKLERGIVLHHTNSLPPLPEYPKMDLRLPKLAGEEWLALMNLAQSDDRAASAFAGLQLPAELHLQTPALKLATQWWNNLSLDLTKEAQQTKVVVKGDEIDGVMHLPTQTPWQITLNYLYFNPEKQTLTASELDSEKIPDAFSAKATFANWPAVDFKCNECWLLGQRLGSVQAKIRQRQKGLQLEQASVDSGNSRLTLEGEWRQQQGQNTTTLKGELSGQNIEDSMAYLGISTPLKKAPFRLGFQLAWASQPWKPSLPSLSGALSAELGKGELADMGGGRAGQLLRLVSFDALLRKLRFDFSDTFGQAFYFDKIQSKARIEKGVLYTEKLLVDGLSADISMQGEADLVRRQLTMQAVVAPELSTTVGVATAFAVNPIAGAAVFAASKVLAPLWDKISLIRYSISGSFDDPKVDEVQRESQRSKKTQEMTTP